MTWVVTAIVASTVVSSAYGAKKANGGALSYKQGYYGKSYK